MATAKELRERIRQLEDRVDYLEGQRRFTLDLLESASTLGDFQTTLAQMQDPAVILRDAASRVEHLLPVSAQAIYLTDERDADFHQAVCLPEKAVGFMSDNVARFIDKGVFAWALREKRPVFMTASDGRTRMLLHVLATSSRVRGMFVCTLAEDLGAVYDHSLALLSIMLLHTANALESFELYRWVKQINADLESKVQDLARSEHELKRHRDRLEELVAERTKALDKTIDRLKKSVATKELLLGEVHHRVRNNLQIIASLLNLQANQFQKGEAHSALLESQARVRSMALIHEHIYKSGKSGSVELKSYLESLTRMMLRQATLKGGTGELSLELDIDDVEVEIDIAMPVGLIVNELVHNCFMHAFPNGRDGHVHVALQNEPGCYILTVSDDGAGLPADFDPQKPTTLGFKLIATLVAQLLGEISLNKADEGTSVTVAVPVQTIRNMDAS